MVISAKRIIELNDKYKFLENLSERELTNPEGVGIDIRVGEVYKLTGPGFLGVTERDTPKIEKVAGEGDKEYTLQPGEYVLVRTMENVNIPSEKIVVEEGDKPSLICVHIYHRSTLHRCGVQLLANKIDPGYAGPLTFGMRNLSNQPFRFEIGARIANLTFKRAVGDLARAYEGQWAGGRVTTDGREILN